RSKQRMEVSNFEDCFFFHAEDGIRDLYVTGVQTCALPISTGATEATAATGTATRCRTARRTWTDTAGATGGGAAAGAELLRHHQIGRASCRERVEISVVAESSKNKTKQKLECLLKHLDVVF